MGLRLGLVPFNTVIRDEGKSDELDSSYGDIAPSLVHSAPPVGIYSLTGAITVFLGHHLGTYSTVGHSTSATVHLPKGALALDSSCDEAIYSHTSRSPPTGPRPDSGARRHHLGCSDLSTAQRGEAGGKDRHDENEPNTCSTARNLAGFFQLSNAYCQP